MCKKLLFLLLFSLSFQLPAQEKESGGSEKNLTNSLNNNNESNQEQKIKKRIGNIEKPNSFRIAPLNILNIPNPCFQIGYERFVSKRYAIHVDAGIIATHGIGSYLLEGLWGTNDDEYSKSTNKGFTVKTGIKYILTDNKRKFKTYISPEFFYLRNKSGLDSHCHLSDPTIEYPNDWVDNFYYNDEQKIGVNIKWGFKSLIGKKFYIELYAGLGIANRKVKQTGHEDFDCNHVYFGLFDKESTKRWGLSIPVSCIFAFRF